MQGDAKKQRRENGLSKAFRSLQIKSWPFELGFIVLLFCKEFNTYRLHMKLGEKVNTSFS